MQKEFYANTFFSIGIDWTMSNKIGYVYDEQMTKHQHPKDNSHPEGPYRIKVAKQAIDDCGLLEKMIEIPSRYFILTYWVYTSYMAFI